MGVFEVHCHILPGVDDGAKDIDISVAMARCYNEQGVSTIIATPHQIPGESFGPSSSQVLDLCDQLNERLLNSGLEIRVMPGGEIAITPETPEDLQKGKVVTLGNKNTACLIELPHHDYPNYTDDVLFSIQLSGITPVLAHPERNLVLSQEPERAYELVKRGVLLQINAGSILGRYGKSIQRVAELFLNSNMVHLIGSDAHSLNRRPVLTALAMERVSQLVGEDHCTRLFQTNPELLLEGREVESDPLPIGKSRPGILSRVLGKFGR